jgi:hypothetical protein
MSEKTTFARWSGKFFYGGVLAFALSVLTAEWLSGELHEFYRESMFWRDLFGADPNTITTTLQKVSWALIFVCSWWMFWKLDSLLGFEPMAKEPADKQESRTEEPTEVGSTESTDPDKGEKEPDRPKESEESGSGESGETFASVQPETPSDPMEAGFAKTLGLEKPYSEEEIKSAYRKRIAQYHPDRVSAMGPEIREVAETKAREINEAYEFFRKKFERDHEAESPQG